MGKPVAVRTEVGYLKLGDLEVAVVPGEIYPEVVLGKVHDPVDPGADFPDAPIEPAIYAQLKGKHRMLIGLGNDEIGYQLPADKWNDSCHACAPFILGGVPQFCPLYPNIDCNTVFQNNVGADVDPTISAALEPLLDDLHD